MRSPDQCSMFTPPFCKFALWVVAAKGAAGYIGHTNVLTLRPYTCMLKHLYDYGVTCMSVLYACDFNKHSVTYIR